MAEPDFQSHRLATPDGALHVIEGGTGPLVLLVSGWPQSAHCWRRVMPRLAEAYRVVALEPPALGESEPARGGYDTRAIVRAIDATLDALSAPDCLLVTHDIGTWMGYTYAAVSPERVRRLVLIDAAIPGLTSDAAYRFTPESAGKTWHFAFNYLPDLPELLIEGRERAFLSWLFRSKAVDPATFDDATVERYAALYGRPGAWSAALGYYRAIFTSAAQNRELAGRPLAMPVLAVGGDRGLGEALGSMLRPVVPDLRSVVIPDCGHYVPEERPEALLDHLLPFLAEDGATF